MDPEAEDRKEETPSEEDHAFLIALGGRLRDARRRRGWSLAMVEQASDGRFKPSAVANYERGWRTISVGRFMALAGLYRVEPGELLADSGAVGLIDLTPAASSVIRRRGHQLVVDVEMLDALAPTPEIQVVRNFVTSVRAQRSDGGPVCTLRAADLLQLARALGRAPGAVRSALGAAVIN